MIELDKYAQLKAASSILGFTLEEFASSLNTSRQVVQHVCYGSSKSARISKAVDAKIEEAKEAWDDYWRQKRAAEKRLQETV